VTGADISDVTSKAYFTALKRKIQSIEAEAEKDKLLSIQEEEDTLRLNSRLNNERITKYMSKQSKRNISVSVCQQDFMTALKTLKPSLTIHDLQQYENISDYVGTD
jgi:SpoVK/Ycf46/Vps4 family AAA+-type ATPase